MAGLILACAPWAGAQQLVKDGQSRSTAIWAAKGLMRSPVSICFDWQGNLYVAETDRAGNAVTDTRGLAHLNAVEEDLKFRSIEDRRDEIHRWIAKGAFAPDFFTKTEDRVRLVRDSDGDGTADTSSVFAGGFNGELDGIGAGVLWLDGALYYTCIPDLWKLKPTGDPLIAGERTSLAHGFGVRWCFYGHDLHGLTPGPDGRIYFSMGDRGFNVTTREGRNLVGVDRGGVFRCWPDGSELELFYQGLRNPQELAFNEIGELFTGDNNCDSGDLARVVHVIEGGDSGWRQDVQSLDSRGPWNREGIWKTLADVSGPARPAWALPPMEYMCAGPSGIALYPGTGESHAYEGCLFLVDFYGSGSTVHAFRPSPQGAGFRVTDHVEYYRGATITDIAWGYDGRLYMSDWGGGWEPNPNGNVLAIQNDSVRADAGEAAACRQVQELFKAGYAQREVGQLLDLLGHRDQRVRLAAQYELARRATTDIEEQERRLGIRIGDGLSTIAADSKAGLFKRCHALWCMGQIARKVPDTAEHLASLLQDPEPEIRAQAAKALGDLRGPTSLALGSTYVAMLSDASPRCRLYAAIALGKIAHKPGIRPLLSMLDSLANSDLVLRHAAAYALELIADPEQTIATASGMGAPARLGAVIALRRLGHPGVAGFLSDPDPSVAIEAARAVYDLRISDGVPVLAAMLDGPIPADRAIEPLLRRAIEANVLMGTDQAAGRLAALAAVESVAPEWRMLALRRLAAWDQPLKREGVWGNWADYPARSSQALREAVRAHVDGIVAASAGSPELLSLAKELQARYALNLTPEQMLAQLGDGSQPASYRRVLLDQVAALAPASLAAACQSVLAADAPSELRARAEELLARADPDVAVRHFVKSAASGNVEDRQRSVRLLGQMESPDARSALVDLADKLRTGMLSPALALEVYDAAMKLPPESSARALAESVGRQGMRPQGFATALLAAGGSPVAGREIFLHHPAAECVRCHTVRGTGGTAGPELTRVAARLTTDKIVESVVEPSAVVAAGFGTVTAMPQMSQILSPREVRDVVAYLGTLKEPNAEPAAGHGQATGEKAKTSLADGEPATPARAGTASGAGGEQGGSGGPLRALAIILLPVVLVVTARALGRASAR